ncbi:MAG: zf-HC2 domain-containing protein [Sedimentisphaerales bacterium]|nr:zf-HC2 domain-containing protein [Sedimentisphaerales bacterium]
MGHISEIELIEYVAGRLDASRREEVRAHIEGCEECLGRRREIAETWDALGQWDVDTAGRDVAVRTVTLAEQGDGNSGQARLARILRAGLVPRVLRVAASIIIAVGVGHKLGRYSAAGSTEGGAALTSRPQYLSALGLDWSSELARLVLEDESGEGGGQ